MHVATLLLALAAPAGGDSVPDYAAVYAELMRLAPRADRMAAVSGLTLERDAARFTLADGTLYLLTPVAGRTVGAVFVGRGSVRFAPPLAVERRELRRAFGADTLDRQFTALVLLFADTTLDELSRRLEFGAGSPTDAFGRSVRTVVDDLADTGARSFDYATMTALLNGHVSDLFHAYVIGGAGPSLLVSIDPYAAEAVSLLSRDGTNGQKFKLVSRFPRRGVEPGQHGHAAATALVDVDRYAIHSTVATNLDFSAAAEVTLTGTRDDVSWAPFALFAELDVAAVTDGDGTPLRFYRPKESTQLWVRFAPALRAGTPRTIRIQYGGQLFWRGSLMRDILRSIRPTADVMQLAPTDEWIVLQSPSFWYPRAGMAGGYGAFESAVFDLTFETPKRYRFASVGVRVEEHTRGEVFTSRWVTPRPESHAAFNIGTFDEFEVKDPRIPPVTVHIAMEAHRQLDEYFHAQQDPKQQVATDLTNSLAFYTQVFGDPPFESFYATEIPGFYGQAFPGLIHLSWMTYQWTGSRGGDESFRAHEMAHQWWGIAVDPLTYRDAWISEGFSDFAGLWYMQTALGNEEYFRTLKEWREEILARRREAGPVWLGTRLEEDYFLIVYQKGAWVLQMLRNYMIDLRTMDESRFKAMMRDFFQEYRGRRASTRDFQTVVERHVGRPMDWFFDQWVRGSDIPTYVTSWTSAPTGDGQHQIRLRVRQENVPDDFRMAVPVQLDFGEAGSAMVRIVVSGPQTDVTLPPVDAKPQNVVVNPLESVLAEMRTEGWR